MNSTVLSLLNGFHEFSATFFLGVAAFTISLVATLILQRDGGKQIDRQPAGETPLPLRPHEEFMNSTVLRLLNGFYEFSGTYFLVVAAFTTSLVATRILMSAIM